MAMRPTNDEAMKISAELAPLHADGWAWLDGERVELERAEDVNGKPRWCRVGDRSYPRK